MKQKKTTATDQFTMNIILIGFASSGKTTAANTLSQLTSLPHVDLDRAIETLFERDHHRTLTIREIFSEVGKSAFVRLEHQAIQELQGAQFTIISTGGHAPVDPHNRKLLKQLGTIIYLKAAPETILGRMRKKGIPASIKDGEAGLLREWQFRDPIYSELSDLVIENDGSTALESASKIVEFCSLEETNNQGDTN